MPHPYPNFARGLGLGEPDRANDRRTHPMTNPTASTHGPAAAPARRSSRAARISHPTMLAGIRQVAIEHGVCIRPRAMRWTNEATGQTELLDLPCGSTREKQCQPCAERAKKLRQVQCREGWHRDTEPQSAATVDDDEEGLIIVRANLEYVRNDCLAHARFDQVAAIDQAILEVEQMM